MANLMAVASLAPEYTQQVADEVSGSDAEQSAWLVVRKYDTSGAEVVGRTVLIDYGDGQWEELLTVWKAASGLPESEGVLVDGE